MKTLVERLRLVMSWRGLSSRKWAEAAHLSTNALNGFFQRANDDPKAAMNAETLFALARAAHVNAEWLFTGHGDPEAVPTPAGADVKESIAALGAIAGVSPAALAEFRAHTKRGASPMYWMALLLALANAEQPVKTRPGVKAN